MGANNLTREEQLKRELAVALKESIMAKIKPSILYRSKSNRKFFRLNVNNGNPILTVLNTGKVYDPEFGYKLGDLVKEVLEVKDITLFTGCWGMTDSPVNAVRESSAKEMKTYFNKIADRLCDTVRSTVDDVYNDLAVEMGLLHKPEHDPDWDK